MGGCLVKQARRSPVVTPPTPKPSPKTHSEQEPVKDYPHEFANITKEADSSINLDERMYTGIFLKQKRRIYWVEEETNYNCFMLFARDLSIFWSEDKRYWRWLTQKDRSGEEIEVASLLDVCWLEINGKFEVSFLTPGVTYAVAFVIMMKEPVSGWSNLVTLALKLPDGSVQQHKENLGENPRGKWLVLQVGEFTTKAEQGGEMTISLKGDEGLYWKRGLMVNGVMIRPKNLQPSP